MSNQILEVRQSGSYHYTFSEWHEPIASVQLGQRVRIHCVDGFKNQFVDEHQPFAEVSVYPYMNPQTGPVFIEGVSPGDTLLVHIEDIEITRDWAVTGLAPSFGLLTPTNFTAMLTPDLPEVVHFLPIRDGRVWFDQLSWPLSPFMGTLGTAPRLEAIHSLTPSYYGGNMDCSEMCPGNTVHLPVSAEGGLFFCGDGHAAQGAGEIGGVACEVPANLVCRFDVIKGQSINWPRISNNDYMMTVGSARPLEDATRIACAELVRWVAKEYRMQETDVLVWLTQVMEPRIGNVCDPKYSVVAAVRREAFES